MNQNQFTLMARFYVSLRALVALSLIVILCDISFVPASNRGVDRMYDHGGDRTVDFDGYCLNEGSCFFIQ